MEVSLILGRMSSAGPFEKLVYFSLNGMGSINNNPLIDFYDINNLTMALQGALYVIINYLR